MSSFAIGIAGIVLLLVLIFTRMNIGIAMGLVGFSGFAYMVSIDPAFGLLRTVPFSTFANQDLCVIPLFLLMGSFAFASGMSRDMYQTVYIWLGRFRGGLAMATIAASAMFAAICGSSIATAATLGKVAMPEMNKYNYDPRLSTGCLAAGGTLGILIPPSIILLLYGILTEQSIAKLFLAGFVPGILQAFFYIIVVAVWTKHNPLLGPRGPQFPIKTKLAATKGIAEVAVLFVLVIGGLYFGIFTPNEAAGVGAFGGFICMIYRRKLTFENLKNCLTDTTATVGMLFMIILGAMLLNYFLSITRLPSELASWVGQLKVDRTIIFFVMVALYIFLGAIMDELAIMLLTIPVIFPVIVGLGYDPIWFGVVATKLMEMGMILPPVGMNVYVIQGVTDVPMTTIYRGVAPFLIADFIEIVLLLIFPDLALFIPNMMTQ